MKKFLIGTSVFLLITTLAFLGVLSLANGYTDPFYVRFTTPQQSNLVLGTSRSAQGVLPSVLDSALGKDFFNYSFTIAQSPFGPTYLNSIKKKLDPGTKNGTFIVTVDPWSISNNGDDPDDPANFTEAALLLGDIHAVNSNPNLEYAIKHLKGKYHTILSTRSGSMFLHRDGWLEVTVDMDPKVVQARIAEKVENYRNDNLPGRKLSSVRSASLLETVTYLKKHGSVYLVRLPVSPGIFAIEQELMPDFDDIIAPVIALSDGYLDMTPENDQYRFTDGNHLWKASGHLASQRIAAWIKAE